MQPIGGSPASSPATAGPAPLNGTCVASAFQRTWNRFSAVRCGVVPAPGEANASLPFAIAFLSSSSVRAGNAALTSTMFACRATTAIGRRSRAGS